MLLEVRDVHTYYGSSHVLQGVDLEVDAGAVLGLLGRNGVGKTTLVHTIAGFLWPRRGSIALSGRRIDRMPAEKVAAHGVALVPQGRRVFASLSVGEHLVISVRDGGRGGWSIDGVCDRFPILAQRWHQRAGLLSGGEQQMLSMARALVANPSLVLMDEPFEGLDPDRVRAVSEVVNDLRTGGTGVLLVEQKLDSVIALADAVEVMERGRLVYRADRETLRGDRSRLYAELGFG